MVSPLPSQAVTSSGLPPTKALGPGVGWFSRIGCLCCPGVCQSAGPLGQVPQTGGSDSRRLFLLHGGGAKVKVPALWFLLGALF